MELVKKGKRVYGAFVKTTHSSIYCAFRKPRDIYLDNKRGEFKSIAKGIEDGSAAWAIDETHLREAKRRGCNYIAVWVKSLKWIFITPIETFFDPHTYYCRNFSSRGGSQQRYVSIKHFTTYNQAMKI